MNTLYGFVFGVYPYICLTVFLLGSLIRFDRDQYTWKSDSSQLLRSGMLRWGSNLFHIGILFLFFGHLLGLLTPHSFYSHFMEAPVKQMLAIISGGAFGLLCFVGLTMLIYRRVFDPRNPGSLSGGRPPGLHDSPNDGLPAGGQDRDPEGQEDRQRTHFRGGDHPPRRPAAAGRRAPEFFWRPHAAGDVALDRIRQANTSRREGG